MKKTAEEIAKEIFYLPATNGKAEESIAKGAQLIKEYAAQQWIPASTPPDSDRWVRVLVDEKAYIWPLWYGRISKRWFEATPNFTPNVTHWQDFSDLEG